MDKNLDAAVKQARAADATVTVTHNGAPVANRDVTVAQKRHKFLFGANWGSTLALANDELTGEAKALAERRSEHFVALFNQATLPFYWGRFEPVRGKPETERVMKAAQWYVDHGCVTKGHPLVWHTVCADWLMEMSDEDILKTQLARINRDVTAFKGVIDMWDVINEVVIMPLFDKYDNGVTRIAKMLGRVELVRQVFEAARAANPDATLLLNDFDMSFAYDVLIDACLTAGIGIDVLGLQSHMHQGYWGLEKTHTVLDRFARHGLPLHFTEITIISGELMPPHIPDLNDWQVGEWASTPEGEERQVREVVEFYTALVSNPAVEAITWWDFSDGAWLNAPAGLLRRDESPKPAYDELMKLIKGAWWLPPTRMTTDADGKLAVSGFLGDYEITVDGTTAPFTLDERGAVQVSVEV